MAQRQAVKRFYYLRAVHPPLPPGSDPYALEAMLKTALTKLLSQQDTQVEVARFGVMSVFSRRGVDGSPVLIACGSGNQGEAADTLHIGNPTPEDSLQPVAPPANRAFINAAFYALVQGDEIVLCMDHLRLPTVQLYLRELFLKAGLSPDLVGFQLNHVLSKKTLDVLAREGVSSIRLEGALYAATLELDDAEQDSSFLGTLRDAAQHFIGKLNESVSKEEQQLLAQDYGRLNVAVEVQTSGRLKTYSSLKSAMVEVASSLLKEEEDEDDDGIDIVLRTPKRSVRAKKAQIYESKKLNRREGGNLLLLEDVYTELVAARDLFKSRGDWEA